MSFCRDRSRSISVALYISQLCIVSSGYYSAFNKLIISLALFALMILMNRSAFLDFRAKSNSILKNIVVIALVSCSITLINVVLQIIKTAFLIGQNQNQISIINNLNNNIVIYGLIVVIISPIMEEIIFKSVALGDDKSKMRTIIIGIIFVVLHTLSEVMNIDYRVIFDMLNYAYFYTVTLWAYRKYDSLLFPIAIHILSNGLALYVTMIV